MHILDVFLKYNALIPLLQPGQFSDGHMAFMLLELYPVIDAIRSLPSRQLAHQTEWTLSQKMFLLLGHLRGLHHLDLIATPQNAKIPTSFVTRSYHPQALWTKAFSGNWATLSGRLYLALSWNLVFPILQKLIQYRQAATLITRNLSSAPWFPLALQLARQPFLLLLQEDLVNEDDHHPIKKNSCWTMLAWSISQSVWKETKQESNFIFHIKEHENTSVPE